MRSEYIILILLMGLVTYLTRAAFLVFLKNRQLPSFVNISLKYIPVSILATLIFPGIFIPHGHLVVRFDNPYIIAGVCTTITVLISRNSVISIIVGIGSLIFFRNLLLLQN